MNDQQIIQLVLCALLFLSGYLSLLRLTARRTSVHEALPAAGAALLVMYLALAGAFCLIIVVSIGQTMLLPALLALMVCAVPAAGLRSLSGRWGEVRPLPAVLLVCWLLATLCLTLVLREDGSHTEILLHFDAFGEAIAQGSLEPMTHFALNAALFVPLGLLLPLALGAQASWLDSAASGLFLTTVIEGVQLLLQRGLCDVEDLAANLLGALLGHALCRVFFPRPAD